MTNISVTGILREYKSFSRDFWLQYKALEAIMQPELWNNVKMQLLRTKRIDEKILSLVDPTEFEVKKQEIDLEWKQKNDEAKQTGIAVHDAIRNALVTKSEYLPELKALSNYQVQNNTLSADEDGLYPEYRMELPLTDQFTLVGVADLIIKEGQSVKIIDYKTADKIEKSSKYDVSKHRKKTFKYPISHIEDSPYNEYQLQLSIYAWMVKKLFPNSEIDSLQIYHIVNHKLKKIYTVDYLEREVEKLINWHVKNITLKCEMEKCREIQY